MNHKEKRLGAWQLTMMALGTVIGGSFFLGSSVAIRAAGPSVVLGFIFGGVLVYFILSALAEMTAADPGAGSFRAFAARAFGEGTGFVTGWVYWTGMVLAMSSEATAVSILVRTRFPGVSEVLLGGVVIGAVTLLNLMGARLLSRLESMLAGVKLGALAIFLVLALLLIVGLYPGRTALRLGALAREPLLPGGLRGLLGSLLIVMFTYAGFEIIGLAATEARDPKRTVPRAVRYTAAALVGLYLSFVLLLLPLVPTAQLREDVSPMVSALTANGIGWAGRVMNFVLITAILSTMLAAMFGLGRMLRSMAADGLAPAWLLSDTDVPRRGILVSGAAMLLAMGLGQLFPSLYLFLISSGGFALLFTYAVLTAAHLRLRRRGELASSYRMPGYPYTGILTLLALGAAMVSMPFVAGQAPGLWAGLSMVALYSAVYPVLRRSKEVARPKPLYPPAGLRLPLTELSEELGEFPKKPEQ